MFLKLSSINHIMDCISSSASYIFEWWLLPTCRTSSTIDRRPWTQLLTPEETPLQLWSQSRICASSSTSKPSLVSLEYVLIHQYPNHPGWAPDQNKTHKNTNISQGARPWCCNTGSLEVFGTRYFQISIQVWNISKMNNFRYIVGGGIHLIGFAILSVCFKSRAPGAKTITTFIRARYLYLP